MKKGREREKKEKSRCNWRSSAAAVCIKLLVEKQTKMKRPIGRLTHCKIKTTRVGLNTLTTYTKTKQEEELTRNELGFKFFFPLIFTRDILEHIRTEAKTVGIRSNSFRTKKEEKFPLVRCLSFRRD